jgi:sugar/nucleoside kinase (ribokinase family)
VDTSLVIVDPSIKTGLTLHLSRQNDRAMLTYLGSIAALGGEEVDPRIFKNTRHVHTASYFLQKGLQPELARLFHMAHAAHATTSLDPGWDPQEKWNGFLPGVLAETDVFLPNEQEALAISHSQDLDSTIRQLSKQIPVAAVKMGADGARAIQAASQAQVKGFYVPSIDTTGAGDSFDSGFLYGYLKGLSLQDSLSWGCACGALNTTRVGGIAGQPTAAEVEEFLSGQL